MSTTVTPTPTGVRVNIPMKVRKPRGRTEIVLPDVPRPGNGGHYQDYQQSLAIAIARGHLWCEMLESGRFSSLREMAAKFGLCESYMARMVRLASLAPDIVEAVMDGNEPRGLSIVAFADAVPDNWEKQRDKYGFV